MCGSSFFLGKSHCWLILSLPFSPSNHWLTLKFSWKYFHFLHLNNLIQVLKNFIVQGDYHVVSFTCRSKLGIVWTLSIYKKHMLLSQWFVEVKSQEWMIILHNSHPYNWAYTLVKQEKYKKREHLNFDMSIINCWQIVCLLEVNLPLCQKVCNGFIVISMWIQFFLTWPWAK